MRSDRNNSLQCRLDVGFTTIELLVAIAITSILLIALTMFVGRAFQLSREHFEQVRITEDARLQIEKISDAVRNAQKVDCNGDGLFDAALEYWLFRTDPNTLMIQANIDGDAETEIVTYYAYENELKQDVLQLDSTCNIVGEATTTTLISSLRNIQNNVPLFTYFKAAAGDPIQISQPVQSIGDVAMIGISLVVDVNERQYPPAARVDTLVKPRNMQADVCSDKDPTQLSSTSTDFALDLFQQCKTYCGGDLANGSCCSYSPFVLLTDTSSSPATTYAACVCGPLGIPASASSTTETVYPSQLTSFVNRCWGVEETAICGTGVKGMAYCKPGCLGSTEAGQCGCDCTQ